MSDNIDWNQRYIDSDTPWDKDAPAPVLQQLLQERPQLFDQFTKAISLGCGVGHDPYLLAQHGISTTGFDLSETAIQSASERYQHPNLNWHVGDLFHDLPQSTYDLVWEHTCFCAIPPTTRPNYITAVSNTLKKGGYLLAVFFIDTGKAPNEGPPFSSDIDTLKQDFSKHFTLELEFTPSVAYEGRENREHLMLWKKA